MLHDVGADWALVAGSRSSGITGMSAADPSATQPGSAGVNMTFEVIDSMMQLWLLCKNKWYTHETCGHCGGSPPPIDVDRESVRPYMQRWPCRRVWQC